METPHESIPGAGAAAVSRAADPRLIVALDFSGRAEAERVVERLAASVVFYKIGLQLLAAGGMQTARRLKRDGRQLFLDWKLHDIGATVEKATAVIAASEACDFLTVHAEPQVLEAAVRGRGDAPVAILGVTVLTSLGQADVRRIGYESTIDELVERRVRQVIEAGADGVIVGPREAALARRVGGPALKIVTPGVRPSWAAGDDQARAETPAFALAAGASHIVCGRPITAAADPAKAVSAITAEMAAA